MSLCLFLYQGEKTILTAQVYSFKNGLRLYSSAVRIMNNVSRNMQIRSSALVLYICKQRKDLMRTG